MREFPEGGLGEQMMIEESMRAMEFALSNVLATPFAYGQQTPIHQPDEASSSS